MKTVASIFIVLSLLSGEAYAETATEPQPAQIQPETPPVQQIVSFDGTWQGELHFDKENFVNDTATPKADSTVRIQVSGPVVRVFYSNDGSPLAEFMPGGFHIAPVYSNAVIWGTHNGGLWVETWAFVVTQKDKDTLLVEHVRAVNNLGLTSDANSKFSTQGHGELKRIAP